MVWVGGLALAIGLPWGAVAGLFPLFGTGIGLAAGTVGLILASQSLANGASRVPLGRLVALTRHHGIADAEVEGDVELAERKLLGRRRDVGWRWLGGRRFGWLHLQRGRRGRATSGLCFT